MTRADLDGWGPPETEVELNGMVSLINLNGEHFASGEYVTGLNPVRFKVPPIEYAPHLRIVASEGWVFQCVTPWEAPFVSENREMFLTRWNTGKRVIVPAGGKTAVGKTFNLESTWILINNINPQTRQAGAIKNSRMRPGDTRPAIPSSMPPLRAERKIHDRVSRRPDDRL